MLAHGRWFSPGTPAFSTTKTSRHDITEILMKVALKHQKSINHIYIIFISVLFVTYDTTLCDKVCQWLAACRWFSPGTPISFTNKPDRHDIAEILLKVVLNTITLTYLKHTFSISPSTYIAPCLYVIAMIIDRKAGCSNKVSRYIYWVYKSY